MTSLRNLSAESARILRATIAAIRPRGHGFDHPIDEQVLADIDTIIPLLPNLLRLAFPLGLRVLEWGAYVASEPRMRMSQMPREAALHYCESLLESRIGLLRTLMVGVRALIFLAFYQNPEVLKSMGVRWDQRMLDTIKLRAQTLDRSRYGYPRYDSTL